MEQNTDKAVEVGRSEIRVTDNKLSVLLNCSAAFAAEPNAVETIRRYCTDMGLTCPIDIETLDARFKEAALAGQDIIDLPVGRGRAPVAPQNEKLIWSRDYTAKGCYIDPVTKMVDYRRKTTSSEVEEGEILVKIKPGIPGSDGLDVYGKTIPVPKPKKAGLKCGSNVVWDEKAGGFCAKIPGRVRLVGATLHVDNVMHVNGDVDSESGNISHRGHVHIRNNVTTDFEVKATGNIEIGGVLNAADVICEGDLVVWGGINGNLKRSIKIKGEIRTKYIDKALIISQGPITADREIVQSHISTRGCIRCEGKIIGGNISATKGILVGQAGASIGTKTFLETGSDPQLEKRLEDAKKSAAESSKLKDELSAKLRQLRQLGKTLTNEQRESMTEIQFQLEECENEGPRLVEEIQKLQEALTGEKNAVIRIIKAAYPGTILKIYNRQFEVHDIIPGPVEAVFDAEADNIIIRKYRL
ncbi:MAG: FapA family protein [Candidatus Zixiibacteriota bacterium]